jgi:uncharacterized protein with NRDE domain
MEQMTTATNDITDPRIDLFHRGKDNVAINSPFICSEYINNDPNILAGSSLKANTNQFGSFSGIRKKDQKTLAHAKCKNKMSTIQHHCKEEPDVSKKRCHTWF